MHVLFVHQNFPAQFGHVAQFLVKSGRARCTFLSERPAGVHGGVECIQYRIRGGATEQTHYCSRTFENSIWHSHAAYEALAARPDICPDLIVAHSGFLSTVFLRELYDCPIINYFEYFYHTTNSDMDFRPDFPTSPRNACEPEPATPICCSTCRNVTWATARPAGSAAACRLCTSPRSAPFSTAWTPVCGGRGPACRDT